MLTGLTWRSALRLVAVVGCATMLMAGLLGSSTSRAQTATPTSTPTTVGSKLNISPDLVGFGSEPVLPPDGVASAPKTIKLSVARNQPAPVTIETPLLISDQNAPPSQFTIQSSTCSVIAPGASCTISIVFQPNGIRIRRAILLITSNASNGTQSVRLVGVGRQGKLTVNPRALAFPRGVVGALPGTGRPVTLINRNPVPLTINSITSSNPDAFTLTNGCPGVLQPSASCTVSAAFSADRNGAIRGAIHIVDNAAGPDSVRLSGSGRGGPTPVRTATATATKRATAVPTPPAVLPRGAFPVMH